MREPFEGALLKFFASRRLRLLNLVVPPHVFAPALAFVRGLAGAGPNPCPVRVLAAPTFGPSRGWPARARELDVEAAGAWQDPVEIFAQAVRREIDRVGGDAGIVIVLAPQHVADANEQTRDVEALLRRADLAEARWIVVDAAQTSLGDLPERLGPHVERVTCVEVEPRERADLELRIRELSAATMRHESASPVGSSRADTHVALRHARALLDGGSLDAAERLLSELIAGSDARASEDLLADAHGTLGNVHVRRGRFLDAMSSYSAAAAAAERAGDRPRAADLYRCAGHSALNAGRPNDALSTWTSACHLLGRAPPVTFGLDEPRKIVVLAIDLAEGFEKRGHAAAALALREQASGVDQDRVRTVWD